MHFQWLQKIYYKDAAQKINDLYGANTTHRTMAYKWYQRFEQEGMQLKDEKRSGRPREVDQGAVIRAILNLHLT